MQLKVGDKVLFTSWAGDEFKDRKQEVGEVLVMHEGDVMPSSVIRPKAHPCTAGFDRTDTQTPTLTGGIMSAKQIAFDQEAREAMKRGIAKLARAVKVTLGPKGRNVIIQKSFGSPTVTKDGVTVAKEIELPDHYENMGAAMVKEVA